MSVPPGVKIRQFQPSDAQAVWDLHNRALEGTGAHAGNGAWDADVRDPISHYLEIGGEFLVGQLGGSLVVMGAFKPAGVDVVEIKRMRVEPARQRQGLGALMLAELEALAAAKGYRMAKLDTTRQQVAAQKLYVASGYAVVGSGRIGSFETLLFEKRLR